MTTVVCQQYQPEASAPVAARTFVAEQLACMGLPHCVDEAQLVVSELVTNVVLHARTPFRVRLAALPGGPVRIEVDDDDPLLPVAGTLDATALSGRGLMLVHAVSARWGADRRRGTGKTVWCELACSTLEAGPRDRGTDLDALLAMWSDPEDDTPAAGRGHLDAGGGPASGDDPGTPDVVVPDLPVGRLVAAKSHMEDVLRELQLVLLAHPAGETGEREPGLQPALGLAGRLDDAARAFADGRSQIRSQALAAAARGDAVVTLHLRLAPEAAEAARRYREVLQDADPLATAAIDLLTPGQSMGEHTPIRLRYLDLIIDELARHGHGGDEDARRS